MFYDTAFRHNQALSPSGLETIQAAHHALNAAVDDCGRAGKPLAGDAAVILLIRNLAAAADRAVSEGADLRLHCVADRAGVIASPARSRGDRVGDDPAPVRLETAARYSPCRQRWTAAGWRVID